MNDVGPMRLNPEWVEHLMGFASDWTVPVGPPLVEPSNTSGKPPEFVLDDQETELD